MSVENQIDFSIFIGQKLVDITTYQNAFSMLIFEDGNSSVECPWRFRDKKVILIGEADCESAPVFYKELFLLSIELEDGLFFDLFHNSNYFEGWVLQGDYIIFSVPGGEVQNYSTGIDMVLLSQEFIKELIG